MKIMKVLGVVVGIHVFALILIFANPGCSSTSKPTPAPVDTVAKSEPAPAVSVSAVAPAVSVSPVSPAPVGFNPDAPALASSSGVRFTPTRPGTAAASTLVAEPVADVTPTSTYTVKSGDSLWTIAKKNHLTVSDLAKENNLKTSAPLREGQKLLIPSKPVAAMAAPELAGAAPGAKPADAATARPGAKASSDSVKHVVKSGETLGTIAKKYGVRSSDLAVANNITDPQKIYAGMELIIPGWQAAAGKAAAKTGTAAKPGATTPAAKPAAITKPAVPEIKPIFTAPGGAAPAPTAAPNAPSPGDVPVIKVDDAPAGPAPVKS